MAEFYVNTHRVQDCSFLIEASTPEEARALWEQEPERYALDRDVIESHEDVDSVEPA